MYNPIRELAMLVLDDDIGINSSAWQKMRALLEEDESNNNDDLIACVKGEWGRYYIPADHKLPRLNPR